jgi:GDP-L-fucose synthase
MRKAMLAPDGGELKVWGSGKPMREIMHVNDAASAVLHSLKHLPADSCSPYGFLNCGTGEEVSIGELAQLVVDVSGKDLEIALDSSKPDGMPRKVMDSSRMNALGWEPKIKLIDGLRSTWKWLTNNWEHPTLSR